ncbi:MAG: IS200/IS605 family transposase [Anaerolineales bacterium]|nr:IS200/IS605 family transposase [Anaerolineales bacterium]
MLCFYSSSCLFFRSSAFLHVYNCDDFYQMSVNPAENTKEIIQQVADELECEIIELEIMPDHVHMLCEVDPHFGVHKFVKRVKGLSSSLLRKQFPTLKSRLPTLWTHSYFISTVGGAPLAGIKQYIEKQKDI